MASSTEAQRQQLFNNFLNGIEDYDFDTPPEVNPTTEYHQIDNKVWKTYRLLVTRCRRIQKDLSDEQDRRRTSDTEHYTLSTAHTALQTAHDTLQAAHDTLRTAHDTLQASYDRLADQFNRNNLEFTKKFQEIANHLSSIGAGGGGGSSSKDPKLTLPSKYNGKRGQAFENWKSAVTVYFAGTPAAHGTDLVPKHRSRVLFIISLLEGNAMTWAQPYIDSISAGTPHSHIDDYPAFLAAMVSHFGDDERAQRAVNKLMAMTQGSRPVTDYIADFSNQIQIAGWKEFKPVWTTFERGLSDYILDKTYTFPEPQTMEEAYDMVKRIDAARLKREHQKKAFADASPSPKKDHKSTPPRVTPPAPRPTATSSPSTSSNKPQAPPPPPPSFAPPKLPAGADPNAMELDAITGKYKLKKEFREQRMKDGLCLRCGDSGHIAKECRKSTAAVVEVDDDEEDTPSLSGKANA